MLHRLRALAARILGLFSHKRSDDELQSELALHLELLTAKFIRNGLSPREARFAALRQFGGVMKTQENYRERRILPLFEQVAADLRYAFRTCRQNPAFSTAVILIASLAIGASTTIFSIFNAVLLRALPYRDADKVIVVWEKRAKEGSKENGITPADYSDWRAQNQVFASLTAHDEAAVTLTNKGGAQELTQVSASTDMLRTYGVQPLIGRSFLPSDEKEGGHVALLSYGYWQRQFGAAPSVLGQRIDLDGSPYTIIGVLPRTFEIYFGRPPDLFVPLLLSGARSADRGSHDLLVIGRLRPEVSLSKAQAEMTAISVQLEKQWPAFNTGHTANLVPITSQLRDSIRPTILVLACAVIFVVLIACANVANLTMARGFTRQRELSVREALGAGRIRLIRLLLSESVLLSATAGVLGAGGALGTLHFLRPILPKIAAGGWIPGIDSISVDSTVLLFLFLVSLFTGLLFGIVPAWQWSRNDLSSRLKESSRSSASPGQVRMRSALVIIETTLSCGLLTGATLLLTSFVRLSRVNPGFQPNQRLCVELTIPPELRTPKKLAPLYTRLVAGTATLPSVLNTALTNYVPGFTTGWRWGLRTETHPEIRSIQDSLKIWMRVVSPGFVSTMAIPVIKGRTLNDEDSARSAPVVLLSEVAAHRYMPGENALGKRIAFGDEKTWRTVVGVVGNVKHLGLSRNAEPEIYVPLSQLAMPSPAIWLIVHFGGSTGPLIQDLRHELSKINSSLAVGRVELIDDILAQSKSPERFNTVLIGSFAALSLLLAVTGIYSVLAFLVTQQTREIGIRMALGAERLNVLARFLKHSGRMLLIGTSLGIVGSLLTSRFLQSFLFDISATSPLAYAAASITLFLAGISAALVPAWRASKVDPIVALREE